MILRIGKPIKSARNNLEGGQGFTLVELILVMAILMTALAVTAPSLGAFFRNRNLDSEARRFVSLTRYGQSRAISEGVPMVLWMDEEEREYGLRPEWESQEPDEKEIVWELGKDLMMEPEWMTQQTLSSLGRSGGSTSIGRSGSGMSGSSSSQFGNRPTDFQAANVKLPSIRFLPDGFIAESSPEIVWFLRGEEDEVAVVRSRNRLHYEISTNRFEKGARARKR